MPILKIWCIFLRIKNNALKILQFNTSQTKLVFYEICLRDTGSIIGLKAFYIDIKTIELVKKQTMFQRKMEDFKGKHPKN